MTPLIIFDLNKHGISTRVIQEDETIFSMKYFNSVAEAITTLREIFPGTTRAFYTKKLMTFLLGHP